MGLGYNRDRESFLTGKVGSTGRHVKFDCGYELPIEQVNWLTNGALKPGDTITIAVRLVNHKQHEHKFVCQCGKEHVELEEHRCNTWRSAP